MCDVPCGTDAVKTRAFSITQDVVGSGQSCSYTDGAIDTQPCECVNGGFCDEFQGICNCEPDYSGQNCEIQGMTCAGAPLLCSVGHQRLFAMATFGCGSVYHLVFIKFAM